MEPVSILNSDIYIYICTSFVPFRSIDRKTKRHRNKIEREITVARYKSIGGMNRIRINKRSDHAKISKAESPNKLNKFEQIVRQI